MVNKILYTRITSSGKFIIQGDPEEVANILSKAKMIYAAHPYGGLKYNIAQSENICFNIKQMFGWLNDVFATEIGATILNPLNCFSAQHYNGQPFEFDIKDCLSLLDKCDVLFLTGDWRESRGCCTEYGFAVAKGIPIIQFWGPAVRKFEEDAIEIKEDTLNDERDCAETR